MTTVRLRILGSFRGQVAGEPANLGPAVLAMLAGAGGRSVSPDALIDGQTPATAPASLQASISTSAASWSPAANRAPPHPCRSAPYPVPAVPGLAGRGRVEV